jgi:phosphatidylglycerol lysyltransferase
MIQFLKKNQKYFKLIFVIAVAFIALTQITGLLKQVQPDKISLIFERLSLFDFVLVILTGLISVVPMLNYDRVLNQLVGTDYPLPKLIRMSWLINTLNNIAGFGGAVSVGLRSHYYGKNVKEKLLANISKVFFFALSGLSIYGLIGFILVKSGQVDQFLSQYTIWLIGAAVYFVSRPSLYTKKSGRAQKTLAGRVIIDQFPGVEWCHAHLHRHRSRP